MRRNRSGLVEWKPLGPSHAWTIPFPCQTQTEARRRTALAREITKSASASSHGAMTTSYSTRGTPVVRSSAPPWRTHQISSVRIPTASSGMKIPGSRT